MARLRRRPGRRAPIKNICCCRFNSKNQTLDANAWSLGEGLPASMSKKFSDQVQRANGGPVQAQAPEGLEKYQHRCK